MIFLILITEYDSLDPSISRKIGGKPKTNAFTFIKEKFRKTF